MRTAMLLAAMLVGMTADNPPNGRTPGAELAALRTAYEAARAEWDKAAPSVPPSDPGWITRYEASPDWAFAPRFVRFSEAHPDDPAAAEAALEVMGMARTRDKALYPFYLRARDLLVRHHLQDGNVLRDMLQRPFRDAGDTEPYFRALLAASSDRDTLARAAMALVHCDEARLRIADRPYFDEPEYVPDRRKTTLYLHERLDPDYVHYFRSTDPEALTREREALLERVVREFADVPRVPPWGKPEVQTRAKAEGLTLGKLAADKLEALRTVGVGMAAPEIEGDDVDGKPLRLSDHRGKVVVLVFWGTWCGPCMGFLPKEKALVERLKGRPFVLLGVNSDADREALKTASADKGITWQSWFDGGSPRGPISSRWNVHAWPTIVVIDKAGVIQFKNLPHHASEPLDEAVDSLLAEAP